MFGLDDFSLDDVHQPTPDTNEFNMLFDEEDSSGSQYSTSKPKEKKKKKGVVTSKEFLSLQSKIDTILVAVTTNPSWQDPELPTPQSLVDRVECLETREKNAAERILLRIKMGIRDLDNRRTADHSQFLSTAEKLISQVVSLKEEIKSSLEAQAAHSQKLVDETQNAYESALAVLQSIINNLRCVISHQPHINQILKLTKEIHTLLFNS